MDEARFREVVGYSGIVTEYDDKEEEIVTREGWRWDEYDWRYVFAYAKKFKPSDVAELIRAVDGENDGPSWTAIFKLKDGSYAYLTASCDYTGWG